jgi:hypothetical protein
MHARPQLEGLTSDPYSPALHVNNVRDLAVLTRAQAKLGPLCLFFAADDMDGWSL